MDWSTFFASLFSSMGGTLGVSLILLRFLKKRFENYIDDAIKYRFDIKLEEYKQKLNKQFSNYEKFLKKYNDSTEIVIVQLNRIEKYLKETQKGINRCLNEQLTVDFIFSQQDMEHSVIGLGSVSQELEQSKMNFQIYLPMNIAEEIETIINLINNYTAGIEQEMVNVQIDRLFCLELLDSSKNIYNKVSLLSELLKEELHKQSGKL